MLGLMKTAARGAAVILAAALVACAGGPTYNPTVFPYEIEEERRLLYVAMTRARQHVVLTHAAYRMRWGKPSTPEPSRFLAALPESVAARTKTEGAGSAGGGRRFSGRFAP